MASLPPCPYVPFSSIDWTLTHPPVHIPPHCGGVPWNPILHAMVGAFAAGSICIAIELILQLLFQFKKWTTLYFWSILICAFGIILFALGTLFNQFNSSPVLGIVFNSVAKVPMMTGFAVVLYSRLNLVVMSRRLLRVALCIVIFVAVVLDPPTVVEGVFLHKATTVLNVIRNCEVIYAVQEVTLAGLYIYGFWVFTSGCRSEPRTRKTMILLIAAEVLVLSLHVVIVSLALTGFILAKRIILGFSYAVKLKVEFLLINSLIQYSKNERASFTHHAQFSDFLSGAENLGFHVEAERVNAERPDPERRIDTQSMTVREFLS